MLKIQKFINFGLN